MTDADNWLVNITARVPTDRQEQTRLRLHDFPFNTSEDTFGDLSIPLNRSNQHSDNTCGRKAG
jgi:hypothetical protein